MKKTLIIDSNNLLYRIFFMNRARGTDVNTLLVFLRCLRSYVNLIDGADNIIAVWDSRLQRGEPNFRRVATQADYKGNRNHEGLEEAHMYDEQIQRCVEAVGGINMFPRRMEADDVIAWLAHNNKDSHITIVTVDQDMYQLIDSKTSVYSPIKKIMVNTQNFEKVTGVRREQFLKYKALIGDKSDNIPGVPRVGNKTALKILNSSGIDSLTNENRNVYENNLKLMDLSHGYNVHEHETESYNEQYKEIHNKKLDKNHLKKICIYNAVYAISNDIDNWFAPFDNTSSRGINMHSVIEKLNL